MPKCRGRQPKRVLPYGPKFVQKTQNLHFLKKPQGFDLFESCSSNYYISDDFSLKQNIWDILFQ